MTGGVLSFKSTQYHMCRVEKNVVCGRQCEKKAMSSFISTNNSVYTNNIIFIDYFIEDFHKPDTALGTWNSVRDSRILSLAVVMYNKLFYFPKNQLTTGNYFVAQPKYKLGAGVVFRYSELSSEVWNFLSLVELKD